LLCFYGSSEDDKPAQFVPLKVKHDLFLARTNSRSLYCIIKCCFGIPKLRGLGAMDNEDIVPVL
jgi:hypothetical protein